MNAMEKVATVYEIALEKVAMEEVYETYGVDGYLPPGYAGAFFEMEKDAGWVGDGVKALGHAVQRGGASIQRGVATELRGGLKDVVHGGSQFSSALPTGMQRARHAVGKGMSAVGKGIQANPGTAGAIGAAGAAGMAGAAGTGYLAGSR